MNRSKKRSLALLLAGIMTIASAFGSMPIGAVAQEKATEEAKATLLLCSDFQTPEDVPAYENISDVPEELLSSVRGLSKTAFDTRIASSSLMIHTSLYTS